MRYLRLVLKPIIAQQKQAKKEKPSQGSAGGLGLSDYLNLGATLLKGMIYHIVEFAIKWLTNANFQVVMVLT